MNITDNVNVFSDNIYKNIYLGEKITENEIPKKKIKIFIVKNNILDKQIDITFVLNKLTKKKIYRSIDKISLVDYDKYNLAIKKPIGICNEGATCFLNSGMQTIVNNQYIMLDIINAFFFRVKFISKEIDTTNISFNSFTEKQIFNIYYLIFSLFFNLYKINKFNLDEKLTMNDDNMKLIIKNIQNFLGGGQQDANDIFNKILFPLTQPDFKEEEDINRLKILENINSKNLEYNNYLKYINEINIALQDIEREKTNNLVFNLNEFIASNKYIYTPIFSPYLEFNITNFENLHNLENEATNDKILFIKEEIKNNNLSLGPSYYKIEINKKKKKIVQPYGDLLYKLDNYDNNYFKITCKHSSNTEPFMIAVDYNNVDIKKLFESYYSSMTIDPRDNFKLSCLKFVILELLYYEYSFNIHKPDIKIPIHDNLPENSPDIFEEYEKKFKRFNDEYTNQHYELKLSGIEFDNQLYSLKLLFNEELNKFGLKVLQTYYNVYKYDIEKYTELGDINSIEDLKTTLDNYITLKYINFSYGTFKKTIKLNLNFPKFLIFAPKRIRGIDGNISQSGFLNDSNFLKSNGDYLYIEVSELIELQKFNLYNHNLPIKDILLNKFNNKKYILYSINVKQGGEGGGHWFSINYFKGKYYETNDDSDNRVDLDYVLRTITGETSGFVSRFLFELSE